MIYISFISIAYTKVPLRMTDKSENLKLFKMALKSNKTKGLKLGDNLEFSINKNQKLCTGIVKTLEDAYLTIYVEDISSCWDKKQMLRRGVVFNFSGNMIEERDIEKRLTRKELEAKRKDFINQLNDINIYFYSFDLKRKKIEAEYNNKIRLLKLEKVKALEQLYRDRKAKADIQLRLKNDLKRVKEAKRYLR